MRFNSIVKQRQNEGFKEVTGLCKGIGSVTSPGCFGAPTILSGTTVGRTGCIFVYIDQSGTSSPKAWGNDLDKYLQSQVSCLSSVIFRVSVVLKRTVFIVSVINSPSFGNYTLTWATVTAISLARQKTDTVLVLNHLLR